MITITLSLVTVIIVTLVGYAGALGFAYGVKESIQEAAYLQRPHIYDHPDLCLHPN